MCADLFVLEKFKNIIIGQSSSFDINCDGEALVEVCEYFVFFCVDDYGCVVIVGCDFCVFCDCVQCRVVLVWYLLSCVLYGESVWVDGDGGEGVVVVSESLAQDLLHLKGNV